jgi:hypothetical protein
MSQIAQALAKAKERTGRTTVPFMVPNASTEAYEAERAAAAAAALRRSRMRQRVWIAIIAVAFPLTAFVVWMRLSDELPPLPDSLPFSHTETSGAFGIAAGGGGNAASAPVVSAAEPARGVASTPAAVQRPELIQLVADLAISAVTPGDPPRIMLAGRIVRAGQAIDGGLVFTGIADGMLQFTDANGVVYTRRY